MLKKLMAWNKSKGQQWANGVTGGQNMSEKWADIKTETREGVEQDKTKRDAKLEDIRHIHQDDNELATWYTREREAIRQNPHLTRVGRMNAQAELAKEFTRKTREAHASRKAEING